MIRLLAGSLGRCSTFCLKTEAAAVGVWGEVDQHLVKKGSFHQLCQKTQMHTHSS